MTSLFTNVVTYLWRAAVAAAIRMALCGLFLLCVVGYGLHTTRQQAQLANQRTAAREAAMSYDDCMAAAARLKTAVGIGPSIDPKVAADWRRSIEEDDLRRRLAAEARCQSKL